MISIPERIRKISQIATRKRDGSAGPVFHYPGFGKGRRDEVAQDILAHDLAVPTGPLFANFLYSAFCDPEKEFLESEEVRAFRKSVKRHYLPVYNVELWTENGAYVVLDTRARGSSHTLKVEGLEAELADGSEHGPIRVSADGLVRFAPKGSYRFGEDVNLAEDGRMIAHYGKSGAENFAAVADFLNAQPFVLPAYRKGETLQTTPWISYENGSDGPRLNIISKGADWPCFAFGVYRASDQPSL